MQTMSEAATDRELVITRMFDAPRELVFRCWTEPDHLVKWFGPTGFTATSVTVDPAEGGAWRMGIHGIGADGDEVDYWASGVYFEVVAPERLVFSFRWDQRGDDPVEDTLVTITFADRDGKTEMTFHQAGFDTVASRDGHTDGWRETFEDLHGYLGSIR
jgi:uncharacterized protein YndB with AHSA1/START domain